MIIDDIRIEKISNGYIVSYEILKEEGTWEGSKTVKVYSPTFDEAFESVRKIQAD